MKNIKQLLNVMKECDNEIWLTAGLPFAHGEQDWTDLPTFGGDEPKNTDGIWSWDKCHLIVGTCAHDLEIVER